MLHQRHKGARFSLSPWRPLYAYFVHTGMHYIEGGWPGSNPKDVEFFERARTELPSEAWTKVVAFGRCAPPPPPVASGDSFNTQCCYLVNTF